MEWDKDVCVYDSLIQNLQSRVNALSWSTNGTHLISSYDNDSVLTCMREMAKFGPWSCRPSFSRKHGAEQTRFIGSSTKLALALSGFGKEKNTTARVWDMVQNRFLLEIDLKSRALRANGISHHPTKNIFLANLIDSTVKLYNAESQRPIAVFKCSSHRANTSREVVKDECYRPFFPVSCFDPLSNTIAITEDHTTIHLVDLRYLDQGPYIIIPVGNLVHKDEYRGSVWIRTMEFTPMTSNLLITTNQGHMILLDSSTGTKIRDYKSPVGNSLRPVHESTEAWCPNTIAHSTYGYGIPAICPRESVIACGGPWGYVSDSDDPVNVVQLWNLRTGNLLSPFGLFAEVPYFVAFNPVMAEIAVGELSTTSWVLEPRKEGVKDSSGGDDRKRYSHL